MAIHDTDLSSENLDEEAHTLSDVYSFLSLTMRYPNPEFLDRQFLETYVLLLKSLGWQEEAEQIQLLIFSSESCLDELQLEYTRLFINAIPKSTVPPYASVYMDGDGTLQGKTTEKIHDFYRNCGFDIADSSEPPDHIQHQLEFLAAIVKEKRFDEEEQFVKTLFRPWFKRFKEQVLREARQDYYIVSIQLIDFFTKEEQ
ncbi:TorD/DmsD family molecular chaperone [Desulfogranum japonicum]|uniref:TorD/DmsD family molecular chaperone n=1 Tax=Desulfogranum japonicum TaxID=231447 RepID=UPI0004068047|nr:molecular chaperone TorD family protein [Desulfogranum japonicum]